MAVICFLADSDGDVKRLACSVDGPFRVEIIEAPLEATALTRRAPGAVVRGARGTDFTAKIFSRFTPAILA